ncbi:MAG TPA: winged helix DNA-binding protein [Novosphingobium sp.]|jgi:predicted MarR family transcription regulator
MSDQKKPQSIVSSAHLAEGASPALSELEFSITLVANAFNRWIVRCAAAAGAQLAPLEILILHSVRHRDRPKKFMDVMLVLHIEDTHLANYAVRKLVAAGLVTTRRLGKEKVIEVTPEGVAFCDRYRDAREALLVQSVKAGGLSEEALSLTAAQLRMLSGDYNQAARAAATL